eukprot:4332371-Pyramimonas_sp.AAC.1
MAALSQECGDTASAKVATGGTKRMAIQMARSLSTRVQMEPPMTAAMDTRYTAALPSYDRQYHRSTMNAFTRYLCLPATREPRGNGG